MKRLAIAAVLTITTAFVAAGCMFGVVTDANTGDPVAGAIVGWKDSDGRQGQAESGPDGVYVIDAGAGDDVPGVGWVEFQVFQPWYGCSCPLQQRLVQYDDHQGSAAASDPWEIQNFIVQCVEVSRPSLTPAPTPTSTPAPRLRPLPTATPTLTPVPGILPINPPLPPPR